MNETYSSLTLWIDNNLILNITNSFTPDFISGLSVALFALYRDQNVHILADNLSITKLEDINKIGFKGGYISQRSKTRQEALQCATEDDKSPWCKFRCLSPDDGTEAVWTYDSNDRWNLIMTDNLEEFMAGFKYICDSANVDMRNYILGPSLTSEGGVAKNRFESFL